jgi:hypothetical protein
MRYRSPFLLLAAVLVACGGGGSYYAAPTLNDSYWQQNAADYSDRTVAYHGAPAYAAADDYAVEVAQADALSSIESAPRRQRNRGAQVAMPGPTAPPASPIALAQNAPTEPSGTEPRVQVDEPETEMARLLVYTAQLTLAIYQVTDVQERTVAWVEGLGGYVSYRDARSMTLRVPAAEFHNTLDELSTFGDVLGLQWQAEEVSDQFRDLDIRLRNALDMRDRLAALLEQAETVADALAIEEQLQRLTLEIEQIRGQLRSLGDRIAFSTITVSFSAINTANVPTNEFRLPFQWLSATGIEYLLSY